MARNRTASTPAEDLENLIVTDAVASAEQPTCATSATNSRYPPQKQGRGFTYFDAQGRRSGPLRDRIEALVIRPPDRCGSRPHPGGHIQATGRDEKGRKQYIYHPLAEVRDQTKFNRIILFAERLP